MALVPSEEHVIVLLPKDHDLDAGGVASDVARIVGDRQVVVLNPAEEPMVEPQEGETATEQDLARALPLILAPIAVAVGTHAGKKAVDGIATVVKDAYEDARRPPDRR